MQCDCKLSVYADAYTSRCIVSIAMEIERSFFSPLRPFETQNHGFSAKFRAPARPVFFVFCLHLFTFWL